MHAHAYFGYARRLHQYRSISVAESLVVEIVVDLAAFRATNYGGESGEAGRNTTGPDTSVRLIG